MSGERLPLAGVRIIDLTTIVVGPACTQRLAEYGAEVIKIEPPEGDLLRALGGASPSGRLAPPYLQMNRGKRSVVLDLKNPAGRAALDILLGGAAAMVSNMRPEALERLGLGAGELSCRYPELVHCTITGFGSDGPYAGRPAYDSVVQGASGVADLFRLRGGEPAYVPLLLGDHVTGEIAAGAIAAALFARATTGKGAAIEVPMYEVMASFVLQEHMGGLSFPDAPGQAGDRRVLSAANRPIRTADGWISVTSNTDRQCDALLRAIGRGDLVGDPRFADARSRIANIDEWLATRNAALATRTTAEWIDILLAADVPCMPCRTLVELADDEHLRDVGFFRMQEHPTEGRTRAVRPTIRYGDVRPEHLAAARPLGWDTVDVLLACGMGEEDVAALIASGAAIDGRAETAESDGVE